MFNHAQLDYNNCTNATNACRTMGTIVLQTKLRHPANQPHLAFNLRSDTSNRRYPAKLPTNGNHLRWFTTVVTISQFCPLLAPTGAAMVHHSCSHPADLPSIGETRRELDLDSLKASATSPSRLQSACMMFSQQLSGTDLLGSAYQQCGTA
ncbi:unnamed protein product [Nezara viridula]|uniref:Uncharacterized protein n=1 Tax=Nezara viridula TaxID=85310 RepID=A0A9P0H409_NEZVI|nr:unnamed protein product [Nezara viridula]